MQKRERSVGAAGSLMPGLLLGVFAALALVGLLLHWILGDSSGARLATYDPQTGYAPARNEG